MIVTGEAMMDERHYRQALTMLMSRSLLVMRVLGVIFVAGGVPVWIYGGFEFRGLGASLIAAGLSCSLVSPWLLVRRNVKRLRPCFVAPWHFELTEHGLRATNPLGSSERPWSSLTTYAERPDFWLLRTTVKAQGIVIPKAAFSAEDQAAITTNLPRLVGRATPADLQPR